MGQLAGASSVLTQAGNGSATDETETEVVVQRDEDEDEVLEMLNGTE